MASPVPPSAPDPVSAQVAYQCSVAVAKALIELPLPGSLSRATAMLKSIAKEQQQEEGAADADGNADSSMRSEDDEYMPFDAGRPASASDGDVQGRSRRSSGGEELEETYQPFIAPGGGVGSSPRSASPDIGGTSSAVSSASIDWNFVNDEVHQAVLRVYDQIVATAQWLEEAEEGEEGADEDGFAAPQARLRLDSITEEDDPGERNQRGGDAAAASAASAAAASAAAAAAAADASTDSSGGAAGTVATTTAESLLKRVAMRWALENVALVAVRVRLRYAFHTWSSIEKLLSPHFLFASPGGKEGQPPPLLDAPESGRRRKRASLSKFADAPAVPGLPSMERVWRSLFGSRAPKRSSLAEGSASLAASLTAAEKASGGSGESGEVDVSDVMDATPAAGLDLRTSTRVSVSAPVVPKKPSCRVHLLPGGWTGDCEDGFVACYITMDD